MHDILEKMVSKILDESGRESIISYTFNYRKEATPAFCHQLETKIQRLIRIDGFRNSCAPGVPLSKILSKLILASEHYPSLEQSIIEVWADLKSDLKATAQIIIQGNKDVLLALGDDYSEKQNNLHNQVDEFARQLNENYSYPLEEARLMTVYIINDMVNSNKSIADEILNATIDTEIIHDITDTIRVDLKQWVSCLQSLPSDSEIWAEIPSFIELVNELANQKIQERNYVKRLGEALDWLKQSYQAELDFFELSNIKNWIPGELEPEQCADLTNKTEELITLLEQHLELRTGEGLSKTISEAELKRKAIYSLEQKIKQICSELDAQLGDWVKNEDPSEDSKKKLDYTMTRADHLESETNNSSKMGSDEKVQINKATGETEAEEDAVTAIGHIGNVVDAYAEEGQTDGTFTQEENQDEAPITQVTFHSASGLDTQDTELAEDTETSSDVGKETGDIAGSGHISTFDSKSFDVSDPEDLNAGEVSNESHEVNDKEENPSNSYDPTSFELLYKAIQATCINVEELPKAWVLLKACRELYGERAELDNLPTITLIELHYLNDRIHHDRLLYSTRRKKLDLLANEIKTTDLSQAQALMHFATSLPLVLAHAYDPLRTSFFYKDYIPTSFEPLYSVLIEHTSKLNVPIINLYGAEQKQQQNEEQRRRLSEQINQMFNQYSAKNKTSIDAFFFPKFGKGPLQWIRDGITNQNCSNEFRTRLEQTTVEDIFTLFTSQKEISFRDQKLVSITAVREGAMDRIQHILNLASAWVSYCDEDRPLDDFHYKAFKQLQLLFDENFDRWIEDLEKQKGDLMVAGQWLKQSLEQLREYVNIERS